MGMETGVKLGIKRISIIGVLFIFGLGTVYSAPSYFIPLESYSIRCFQSEEYAELAQVDTVGDAEIEHEVLIYVFDGYVNSANITVPFPLANLTQLGLDCFSVFTTTGKSIGYDVSVFDNRTVLRVKLPETIYAGDDYQFMVRYQVEGFTRPMNRTYWDKILGRENNRGVTFNPPHQGVTTNEMEIEIYIPPGSIIKKWGPGYGKRLMEGDQYTVGVGWRLKEFDSTPKEFSVVFGEGGMGKNASIILIAVGITTFVTVAAIALFIRSRYGHSPI